MFNDTFYMELAKLTALNSKDPKTKVGAVLVKDSKVLSLGYNGAPRNFPDDLLPKESNPDLPLKEQKNTYMVHAEVNAILNYGGSLKDLKDSVIYVTVSPCIECSKVLVQCGIKKVIYLEEYHKKEIWETAKIILTLGRIKFQKFNS